MERSSFREAVFERDGHKCVFCKAPAVDAHHLIERRLWEDGGYHVDNGISVCSLCHISCESTVYSVEEGRQAAGITKVIVPEHMDADIIYDKWGNAILSDGRRSPGPLFNDPGARYMLRHVLHQFLPYVKYPKTYHLPWSNPTTNSDRILTTTKMFEGKEVIVTEKMDGENTSIYRDRVHARSIDSASHPSQSWVRGFAASFQFELPTGYRVCGENVYGRHSIAYSNLDTYFFGFSVWDHLTCLSWCDTLEWFELLGITPVPILYEGKWNRTLVHAWATVEFEQEREGYVVRLKDAFEYKDFRHSVAKYVRPNHLQTPSRWSRQVQKNTLAA